MAKPVSVSALGAAFLHPLAEPGLMSWDGWGRPSASLVQ